MQVNMIGKGQSKGKEAESRIQKEQLLQSRDKLSQVVYTNHVSERLRHTKENTASLKGERYFVLLGIEPVSLFCNSALQH